MSKYSDLKLTNCTEKKDCTVIALSILCNESYQDAYSACELFGRKIKKGFPIKKLKEAFNIFDRGLMEIVNNQYKGLTLGIYTVKYELIAANTGIRKLNNTKYTMRTIGKDYPKGNYLVRTASHVAALIDGKIEDWTENRCHRIINLYRVMDYPIA